MEPDRPIGTGVLKLTRIYATPDGETHMEDLEVASGVMLPGAVLVASVYRPSTVDWHVAPRKQFAIHATGAVETTVSDGTTRRFGPGAVVYLEDTAGKGHLTRMIDPVTNFFVRVPEDFDVLKWARGE